MKTFKKRTGRYCILLLMALITGHIGLTQSLSQSVLCSSGESFSDGTISLDFVLGELVSESYSVEGTMLCQGFLNPEPDLTAVNEMPISTDEVNVFPNPLNEILYVSIDGDHKASRVEVIDMQGNTLFMNSEIEVPMSISLSHLPAGIYMLRIVFENQNPICKRIIKTNY